MTKNELAARLGERGVVVLDVRTAAEYRGDAGYPCDARRGHIPGAKHVPFESLLGAAPERVRELVGAEVGDAVIAYCHSGQRSALAVAALAAAGVDARNYVGSWHEWSADDSLPVETTAPAGQL